MNIKHLPNALTMLRIVLVPAYLFSLYIIGDALGLLIALTIFIVAGITDYFDGLLARKLDCVTDLGKIIDPLADKLVVSAALISLAIEPFLLISIYAVAIIIFRELLVTIMRKYYTRKEIYLSANYWGKVKTATQMAGIIGGLLYSLVREYSYISEDYQAPIEQGIRIFFWIVVVITIVSGLSYIIQPKMKDIR